MEIRWVETKTYLGFAFFTVFADFAYPHFTPFLYILIFETRPTYTSHLKDRKGTRVEAFHQDHPLSASKLQLEHRFPLSLS